MAAPWSSGIWCLSSCLTYVTKDTGIEVLWVSQVVLAVKNPPVNAGDKGSVPGSGIPWRMKWQPTPVGNPMDRGVGRTAVLGVTKSWTWLKQHSMLAYRSGWLLILPSSQQKEGKETENVFFPLKSITQELNLTLYISCNRICSHGQIQLQGMLGNIVFLMTMFLDLKTYKEKGEVRHWRANNILHYKVCALREEEWSRNQQIVVVRQFVLICASQYMAE